MAKMLGFFPSLEHELWDRKRTSRSGLLEHSPQKALECEDRDPSWYLKDLSSSAWDSGAVRLVYLNCEHWGTSCGLHMPPPGVHRAVPMLGPQSVSLDIGRHPEQWGQ